MSSRHIRQQLSTTHRELIRDLEQVLLRYARGVNAAGKDLDILFNKGDLTGEDVRWLYHDATVFMGVLGAFLVRVRHYERNRL